MKFIPQRRNLNKHTPHGLRLLEKSLQQDGFIDAQTAAADGEMISGSARLEVAADKFADVEPIIVESDGTRPVVVVRTDIPNLADPRARRLSVAANQIAKTDFDPDGELLAEWGNEDKDIKAMFAESEWEEITGEEKPVRDAEPQIDRAAELLEKWKVQTGDLWQIGEHRLICGDCTDPAVVARVMGGEKADCCVSDPPYGVLDNEWDRPLKNQDVQIALDNTTGAVIMFNATKTEIIKNILNFENTPQRIGVWRLTSSITPKGKGMFWTWQPFFVWRASHIKGWDAIDFNNEMPTKTGEHPTQKPVPLIEKIIESIDISQIIIDFFCGSGTTLVACQNLGRRGRAIEISPAYVAVSLQRMADAFPGIEIRKIE